MREAYVYLSRDFIDETPPHTLKQIFDCAVILDCKYDIGEDQWEYLIRGLALDKVPEGSGRPVLRPQINEFGVIKLVKEDE